MRQNLPTLAAFSDASDMAVDCDPLDGDHHGSHELANAEDARRVLRRHHDDEGRFVADGQFQAQVRAC
jgi:hypothetical protein